MSTSLFGNTAGTFTPSPLLVCAESSPFNADGTGTVDATAAIQAALTMVSALGGGTVWLTPGHRYKLTSKLTIPSYCYLRSDNAFLLMSAANFNNSDASISGRYGSNAVGIDLSGMTTAPYTPNYNNGVVGIGLIYDRAGNNGKLCVQGIVARNVINTFVQNVELSGFPVSCGLKIASSVASNYVNNYIHDFYDNNVWSSPAEAQITGIEFDNDLVNRIPSTANTIAYNRIVNMVVGAASIAGNGGYQTDGINIANKAAQANDISHNYISGVGEGIDCYAGYNNFTGNRIYNTYNFGIKFIHGAQYNTVTGGVVVNFGLAALICAGSSTAAQPTAYNTFQGVKCVNGDYLGVWTATGGSPANILLQPNGGTAGNNGQAKENTFTDIVADQGANCKYGMLDLGDGPRNIANRLKFKGGAAKVRIYLASGGSTTGYCTLAEPTKTRAYLNGNQVVTAGANVVTKVTLNATEFDYRAEFDPTTNYRWTAQVTGNFKFDGHVTLTNMAIGEYVQVELRRSGTQKCVAAFYAAAVGNNSVPISGEFSCIEGDYVELYVVQVAAWGANRTVLGNSAFTYLNITAA